MNGIKIKLLNFSSLAVFADASKERELREHFSFMDPKHRFMPRRVKRNWDGRIRLYNSVSKILPAGLHHRLRDFCASKHWPVEVVESGEYGIPSAVNKGFELKIRKTEEIEDREYQLEAVRHGVGNKRAVIVASTGSGKSFIMFNLLSWFLDNREGDVLVVVPSTNLVEQMFKEFSKYGMDAENGVHRIYAGREKASPGKRTVVSTWQSIHKLSPEWFERFGCVIGDEVHNFKAKSLVAIMNKCVNAEFRFGLTGTLDGTKVHKLVLEGLFGPVRTVVRTKKLQESGVLAKIRISVPVLRHPAEDRTKRTWQEEMDFLVTHEKRNRFIRNLALDRKGNTLVLFQYVEKHGKVLYEMAREGKGERKVFYVSGETATGEREDVRSIVENETDAVIIASYGVFSTGINIRNLHNIIFASPSKSRIRVLQSIGRGLRTKDDGSDLELFDVIDDMHVKRHRNYALRHGMERLKMYDGEEFPYKIHKIDLTKTD